jgi:putative sigma-54 modulation protein
MHASPLSARYRRTPAVQIDIHARGFSLSMALRTLAEQRLRLAFGSTGGRGLRVGMRLAERNGSGGRSEVYCRVRALIPGADPVVIEQHESDLLVAIDRAADRAGRAVSRLLAAMAAGGRISVRNEASPAGAGRRAF